MSIKNETIQIMEDWEKLIAEAPDDPAVNMAKPAPNDIDVRTGLPKRYRAEWPHPADTAWTGYLEKIMARVKAGGIVALIGNRGTGKTRLAAETMRGYSPSRSHYTTAMGLFLRIRASFDKKVETEAQIVEELAQATMLVIDEIQERGNTAWEDRLLTHILDRRYGAMRPTILIANLEKEKFIESVGDSIASRISETGGVLTITGKSFRD